MHWLIDHPGALYLALGLVAVGFLVAFHLSRRVVHLSVALGCLALMGVVWLLTQWIVTDSKQIDLNVRRMAADVVNGNTDDLFRYVAKGFRFGNMDRDALYAKVKQAVQMHHVDDIRIFDYEVETLSRPDRRANVNFKATIYSADGTRIFLFRSVFVLEDEVWKIQSLKMFNPLVNTDQAIDIP